jgi:type II secretory pathway pseudopilin PulG
MLEEKKTKFCSNCGAEIDIRAKICPKCGVEQPIIPEKVSNWWFLLPISLGIPGGIIAWVANKNRNPKKALIFLIIGIFLPIAIVILGILASILLVSLGGNREAAKDARIMANMSQLRAAIEIHYWDREEGFSGINCSLAELSSICNDVEEYAGEKPTIESSAENYCFYAKLLSGEYYCLTGLSSGRKTTTFPGSSGYCDGRTFICP